MSGIRGMAQQHDLFSDLLRTADYMKAFISQRINSDEELRLRLEQAEASLSAGREDNEALRMERAEAQSREESCGPAFFTCVPTRSVRLAFYL